MAVGKKLKTQLEEACEGLWWSSESDYPVEVVWVSAIAKASEDQVASEDPVAAEDQVAAESVLSTEGVCRVLGIENADELTTVEVKDFFARSLTPKSWHTAEDKAQIAQLQQLKTLLVRSLQSLTVYRVGSVEIDLYILGLTPDGTLSGVKTRLVET